MTRIAPAAACLALAWAGAVPAAGPHDHAHDQAPAVEAPVAGQPPAPAGFVARYEDEVRPAGPGLVAWSTRWMLCWEAQPGATHYELRVITSEGAPRQPRRIDGSCWGIEVAAGENPPEQGMPQRELMLAMQAAQTGVQVRAVLAGERRSAWSAEQAVGRVPAPPGR